MTILVDPEKQHEQVRSEYARHIAKSAKNMARARYTFISDGHIKMAFDFKVYIQIWQDEDWNYTEFRNYCKKLTQEQVKLNTNSYKAMADQLYLLITKDMPGRNIWIFINNDDIGINIKYEL